MSKEQPKEIPSFSSSPMLTEHRKSAAYADLSNGSPDNGTKIQGYMGPNDDNQRWFITDVGDGFCK